MLLSLSFNRGFPIRFPSDAMMLMTIDFLPLPEKMRSQDTCRDVPPSGPRASRHLKKDEIERNHKPQHEKK